MKIEFAPMEGIVNHVYRRAHAQCFTGIHRYFAPFIVADQTKGFMEKDLQDILPENNKGYVLIPQILTNNASDFINTANKIAAFGYSEINLNLGCPSKTVVSGGRGSGFLSDVEGLRRFFEAIFASPQVRISVKTRIGRYGPEEFDRLLEIYNDYPLTELIIHPRIRTDMYNNTPNYQVFKEALQKSKHATVYNGDVRTYVEYRKIYNDYGKVNGATTSGENTATNRVITGVMIGRGLLANPALAEVIASPSRLVTLEDYRRFHACLLEHQEAYLLMPHKVLSKMKEVWRYLAMALEVPKPLYRAMQQSQTLETYSSAVESLFNEASVISEVLRT